ncbi:hypothetical protein BCR42DRAFT_490547 [Absidia repens]|uniref:Uncharacterized protein n=1 Tax=Absidia repens TaxID=90262 RepID=A0A1X2IJW7_9FUNG|nr:hypothetical protein BCR42DRAFT_490547 [Absidia repens]
MGSTPPLPPSSTTNTTSSDDLPQHIPVDMGMAPRAHPYEHHSVYPPKQQQQQQHQHHQHSLSPEQLGVVGYVKDVAGFVKDTVQDIRENRQRRRSSSVEANQHRQRQLDDSSEVQQPEATTTPQNVSPPPPAQQQLASSPLATIATGMFPGISGSGQQQQQQQQPLGTSPPCTHAEALRQDLREQLQHSSSEKEHRIL